MIFLYVLDNDTNTLVRFSLGIGLLIEIWKIHKVTNIEVDRTNKLFGLIPRIRITDKGSYVDSSTKEYDLVSKILVRNLGIYELINFLFFL